MASILPNGPGFVCNACRAAHRIPPSSRSFSKPITVAVRSRTARRPWTERDVRGSVQRRVANRGFSTTSSTRADRNETLAARNAPKPQPQPPLNPAHELAELQKAAASIIDSNEHASEKDVTTLLRRADQYARYLIYTEDGSDASEVVEQQSSSAVKTPSQLARQASSSILEDLDEDDALRKAAKGAVTAHDAEFSLKFRREAVSTLAETLYNLLRAPNVTITRSALRAYTLTQCLLGKPEYLPEIFDLFVFKTPPRFTWLPSGAIPKDLADIALAAAIHKRDMGLAVAITDTTVGTSAYWTQRFIDKALPKLLAITVFPFTVNTAANWASTYQNTFEVSEAKNMALAAGFAYIGTFGTVAYVAVTTWSDHHDRVHWQSGAGLTQRWLREDERAFLDKIAQSWGFGDKKMHGLESGPEWDALRDTIGVRVMVLDKTEFMPGFN
ncbi:uncharacterized protein AB675_6296 [Cyphellophora attinorum]|uniref:Uncharacterized protein n=1 Tax=Cyphellophora attinorum TaxID=1664694 RepID=A0A0N1P2S1_9EURO|nr:uncharacterized protein AB675_6296 [Phialophora attinorum]KPI43967.1 hypothetical protein AB675_6296 [Phialophora attinorum]